MKKNKEQSDVASLPTFEKLHGRLVSRRDFLGAGLIPFSASLVMPNWLQLFARSGVAQAADVVCQSGGAADMAAFVTLKLSGGAGLAANFIPLDANKQLLASYSKIGLGKGSSLPISVEFSNMAGFYSQSGILAGIRGATTPLTLQRSAFFGVPVRSQDDSSANKFDLSGMVAKAGVVGSILPNMGRANTETGLNASYALIKPSAPLVVSRFEDVDGALGVGGILAGLQPLQKQKLFNAVKNISASQALAIENMSGGKTLSQLMQCANIGNSNLIANSTTKNISPLGNTAFAQIWGITAQTSTSSQNFVFATMVFNAINGNAGTVNLDIGGYDYHDGTRTSGDTKDNQAGDVIGKILQSFAVMNKRGFLVVCSDGAVSSAESDVAGAPWMSDRGTGGMMYMMAYDPTLTPQAKGTMIGNFTDGQVADDTTLTGGSADKAAAAIFANYLNFNKKLSQLEQIIPRQFSTADLANIIVVS